MGNVCLLVCLRESVLNLATLRPREEDTWLCSRLAAGLSSIFPHTQGPSKHPKNLNSGWSLSDGGQVLLPENQDLVSEEAAQSQCC